MFSLQRKIPTFDDASVSWPSSARAQPKHDGKRAFVEGQAFETYTLPFSFRK